MPLTKVNTAMVSSGGGDIATNAALGSQALNSNTSGANNTAVGNGALQSNTTASNNTAVGYQAGYSQNNGFGYNTFVGNQAGYNSTGTGNSFFGANNSGGLITTGNYNTIIGNYNGNNGGLDIRTASNYIVLSDGAGNPRAYWNPSGYLKASNSGTVINSTGAYHELASDSSSQAVAVIYNSSSSQANDALQVITTRNTTNNSYHAIAYYNNTAGAYRFRVADSGNVTNTNGSYGTISDIKNKENIVDATPKLEKINQLQVRNFNFKGDDLKQIGFIAQEFEQVFPSMIEEHKDTDAEGNDLGTTTKSIKTSVLVPILVKAIQELNAKVEAQAAEIAALKAK